MKLIIQIPCYNEEMMLPITLASLPKALEGIDKIEVMLIDDGSTDRSIEIAEKFGVEHIIKMNNHKGLARTFMAGLQQCVKLGADIIVNIDADNQYNAEDMEILIKPLLEKKADIVVGTRPIERIKHFSILKKILQKLGSYMIRLLSSTGVEDAPSGFRAFTREAATMINVFDNYTYTLETIIQSKSKGLIIASVPIRVNAPSRTSRLFKNLFEYVRKSSFTMLRMFIIYRPFRFFAIIGAFLFFLGLIIWIRFLFYYILGDGNGHIQSLLFAAVLMIIGFQTGLFGVFADLLAINRKLIEDVQVRIKKIENK